MPPTREPITARPRQKASTTTRPIPSEREGRTRQVDSSSAAATSCWESRGVHSAPGTSATSRSTTCASAPVPTIRSLAAGSEVATPRQARASPSTFL